MSGLKVYAGLNSYKGRSQARMLVAAKSRAAACRAVSEISRMTTNYMRDYWSVTGNQRELEIALASPMTVFVYEGDNRHNSPIVVAEKK